MRRIFYLIFPVARAPKYASSGVRRSLTNFDDLRGSLAAERLFFRASSIHLRRHRVICRVEARCLQWLWLPARRSDILHGRIAIESPAGR